MKSDLQNRRIYGLLAVLCLCGFLFVWVKKQNPSRGIEWVCEIDPTNYARYCESDAKLESLALRINKRADLSKLRLLENLRELDLAIDQPLDFRDLMSLKKLDRLRISSPTVEDLGPISHLKDLKFLDLSALSIRSRTDVTLPAVEYLRLSIASQGDMCDLTFLSSGRQFRSLSIEALSNHVKLPRTLEAESMSLTVPYFDVESAGNWNIPRGLYVTCHALVGEPNGKILDSNLHQLRIRILEPLAVDCAIFGRFPALKELEISGPFSEIRNLEALSACEDLEVLRIENYEGTLRVLDPVSFNRIGKIRRLSLRGFELVSEEKVELPSLKFLDLVGPIPSVLAFSKCPIEELEICSKNFTNGEELLGFQNLKTVDLRYCKVHDWNFLDEFTNTVRVRADPNLLFLKASE